jgi:hypothetical protein
MRSVESEWKFYDFLFIARAAKRFNDAVWNALLTSYLLYIKWTLLISSVYECMYVCMGVRTCWCSNAIGQFVHTITLESLLFQSSALANQILWMKFIDPQTREQYPCSYTQPPTSKLHTRVYTRCPRRNVPDFRRVFLMLKYTDITQNTYIQSWTVTEIMAREKCSLLAVPRTVPVQLTRFPYTAHVLESGMQSTLWLRAM